MPRSGLPRNWAMYPTLPFAVTGNAIARTGHMRFPGSVSLPPEVFFGVVRGVAQSALTAGFKVVLLMGDHGGGQEELALAAKIALADATNGVQGHPQFASAELGKVYLDLKVDLAVKQIRALLASDK